MTFSRLRARRQRERERAAEMDAHIQMAAEELIERGRRPEDALREARLQFGNPRVKLEEAAALERVPILETAANDLRSAVRSLRASPGFVSAVLLVLVVATAASTAVYSVVDAVALRGLPFPRAERLAAVEWRTEGKLVPGPFTARQFLAMRATRDAVEGVAAIGSAAIALKREDSRPPESLRAQRVSAEFFSVFGVKPALGRPFTAENEVAGQDAVAVISDGLWRRRFGGAADVIGRRLATATGGVEIIGVMPPSFAYPVGALQPTEVWIPYVIPPAERAEDIRAYLRLVARLRDGATLTSAEAPLAAALRAVTPTAAVRSPRTPGLRDLHESITGRSRGWMLMLLGSVGLVLLIAIVNVANLLLVRATTRTRELSVRSVLGATRWDLARLLIAESLVLSIAGTALGALAAYLGIETVRALVPADLPRVADIAVNLRVLTVAAATAIITGVAFGVAPAFQSSQWAGPSLRADGRAQTAPRRRQWFRGSLLVSEVGLAMVLLVGAGLFLGSFVRLLRVDVGLDYRDVLVLDVRPPLAGSAPARAEAAAHFSELMTRVGQLPGVRSVAAASANLPFSFSLSTRPIEVADPSNDKPRRVSVAVSKVTPNYLQTIGVPLLRGRGFSADDVAGMASVVLINESAARVLFPDQDPIGKVVGNSSPQTVVGVVGDTRGFGPEQAATASLFEPLGTEQPGGATLVIKMDRRSDAIVAGIRGAAWSAFSDLVIPPPQALEESFGRIIAERRFTMLLLSVFGVLGVAIASAGIYGVMSYVVAQRTREIGIRMALGAAPAATVLAVLRRAMLQVAGGVLLGLAASWLLATSVESFLFRGAPHDWRLYGIVVLALMLTALVAAIVPSRRAARVDPLIALRSE